ncbi:MAG: hypothetical protein ACYCW5_01750 [Thermoleophilia bacterium]
MQFKGGLVNGTMASIYGAASYICLFMAMNQHDTMKTICYVLGAVGIILAAYWFVTSEVMAIPIILTGICHIGLAARADHVGMQIGCTGLAVVAFAIGIMMLTKAKPNALPSSS